MVKLFEEKRFVCTFKENHNTDCSVP